MWVGGGLVASGVGTDFTVILGPLRRGGFGMTSWGGRSGLLAICRNFTMI